MYYGLYLSIELGSEDWKDNPVAVCYGHANEKSTGAVELGFRLSKSAMDETGITIGDRVDILYDKEENQWMIKKISEGGFGVSGQKQARRLLIVCC